ncbi:MAG: leucine-rich repeat protein [Bacillota bacterium]
MKKYIFTIVLIFPFIFLIGCTQDDLTKTYYITLSQEDQPDINIEALNREEIELPTAEKENHFFLGWSDGDNLFYDRYIPEQDITLVAEFEHIEDAFAEINYIEETKEVVFIDFIGEAKHIILPHNYNGYYISNISNFAFENSLIESIKIPNSVLSLSDGAFKDATELREIIFYGDMAGYKRLLVPGDEVERTLNDYDCTIDFSNEPSETDPWIFPDGCPFTKIIDKSEPVNIPGQGEFYTYTVIQDLSVYTNRVNQNIYNNFVFEGANNLEKIHLPKQLTFLHPEIFLTNHKLKTLTIDESNQHYTTIDNILYHNDTLAFYPGGLKATEYYIPDFVTRIENYAFINQHLKTIYIHEKVINIKGSSFYNSQSLENIIVDENHKTFLDKDGILYYSKPEEFILVAYPAGKKASSFNIPSNIRIIGGYAFANQNYLETIEFNQGLNYIQENAFFNAKKIQSIDLPETIIAIHASAFYMKNNQLKTIYIRNKEYLLPIGTNVFKRHDELEIYIPQEISNEYFKDEANNYWIIYREYLKTYTDN